MMFAYASIRFGPISALEEAIAETEICPGDAMDSQPDSNQSKVMQYHCMLKNSF
jgi:hypothetical protein